VPSSAAHLAAIDLGSNSFHLTLARFDPAEGLTIVDRLRDRVALNAGLQPNGMLDLDAMERGWAALRRFAERLGGMENLHVRATGTSTLRDAHNSDLFLERALEETGFEIEVISGFEEARLIFMGAVSAGPTFAGPVRVIDIGGGSTEIAVGEGRHLHRAESLNLGCVRHTKLFFPGGEVTPKGWRQAIRHIRDTLEPYRSTLTQPTDAVTVGCSGTIRSIGRIAKEMGYAPSEEVIPASAVRKLVERIHSDAKPSQRKSWPGLTDDRIEVIAGGLAILSTVMESLGLEQVHVSMGALREGVLESLRARIFRAGGDDPRQRTIEQFQHRYRVDRRYAQSLADSAVAIFDTLALPLGLPDEGRALLEWSAQLHCIGLSISHDGYHRHSAYMLRNADMAGFSLREQRLMAGIVHHHRKRPPSPASEAWAELVIEDARLGTQLAAILRVAVALNRSRDPLPVPLPALLTATTLTFNLERVWYDRHPLVIWAVHEERKSFRQVFGRRLRVIRKGAKAS